jgi:precorrin-6B C5,15-methyltransferase / cobalt-precorrin-6B C5,C15-methyltransferase
MSSDSPIAIVGLGDDGLAGLSPLARQQIDRADILVGGKRHLAMLPPTDNRPRWQWDKPLDETIARIIDRADTAKICVLASGDPMCYGIGTTLRRHLPPARLLIMPAPSAFSLACARLGWSLPEVETLSLCGRDPNLLSSFLYPHARILVLSADRSTASVVAQLLQQRGYGDSKIAILEHLGGAKERRIDSIAKAWGERDLADLNTIAIHCIPSDRSIPPLSRMPGLPDPAYCHDGQLTKREVRAITLSALAPQPGELLWDVGAGCGSIGIEWSRFHPRCQSIAIEHHPQRLDYIALNAHTLGVPNLTIVPGFAPAALVDLPAPDAIFIGGGLTVEGVFDTCWHHLKPGGRLVANAVTVETELKLFQLQQIWGGSLSRISIQTAEPVGKFLGWKGRGNITQWQVISPLA